MNLPRDELDVARTIRRDAPDAGDVLSGRYRLEKRIGSGGMGQVWQATDLEINVAVAVKLLPAVLSTDRRAIDTLRREAAVALRLSHPHICRLHTLHVDGERVFLVMELVEGRTLQEMLEQRTHRRMTWAQFRPLAEQIASAIDYAHSLTPPVLHRDIKPANIMVDVAGQAKVLDFGVAREVRNTVTGLTGRADTAGTVQYMSPEQFRGDQVSAASDRYSFAAVLYECLAGRPLVSPEGDIDFQVLRKKFEPIEGVPAVVNTMLRKGLSRQAQERPSSCSELVAMPQQIEQQQRRQKESQQQQQRRPWPAWVKWCLVIALVSAGLWGLIEWQQHQQRRHEAAALVEDVAAQQDRLAEIPMIEQATAWSDAHEIYDEARRYHEEGEYRRAIERYKVALSRYSVAEQQAHRLAQQQAPPEAEEDDGWCFIATAVYGSYDAGAVKTLRRFRDEVLLPAEAGRAFVSWYYALSPRWAEFIAERPAAQWAVRIALTPVVALAAVWIDV